MEDVKNKNQVSKMETDDNIKYVVMPEEFRKAPVRKGINKKILIIAGAGIAAIVIVAVAVFVFWPPKSTPIVKETPPPPPAETSAPPEPELSPTSTPPGGLLQEKPTSTEEEKKPELVVAPAGLPQGQDSDADGITDKEEAIYQTDTSRPDTDNDGYLDGNEIFNLYNAASLAPAGILESGIVKLWRSASGGYQIYYPRLWTPEPDAAGYEASFKSQETEGIDIKAYETDENMTLRSWYITKFPDGDVNGLQTFTSKKGLIGLQDANRLNTFIKQGVKVFVITYNLGDADKLWYRRTYDMMLNSLKIE